MDCPHHLIPVQQYQVRYMCIEMYLAFLQFIVPLQVVSEGCAYE